MAEPTLVAVFGASATQDTGVLNCTLSELGITDGANASAEAVFMAILNSMYANQDTEPTTQIAVSRDNPSTQLVAGENKLRQIFTVTTYRGLTPDPEDF
jgi:hypothetical protein